MDKNLKKLNRVQLLQLMLELSEDRDALIAENAALKKHLSEQSKTRSTMKVGSIAEAALQANGYFESAQHAADDYLREIKRMRDQIAARSKAMAPRPHDVASEQVQQQLQIDPQQAIPQARVIEEFNAKAAQEARAMSDRILARATSQAKTVVNEAQAQSDAMMAAASARCESIVADANRQSHTIVLRANRQAEAIVAAAKQQADAITLTAAQTRQQLEVQQAETASSGGEATGTVQMATLEATPQQQKSSRRSTAAAPSSTAEIRLRARHFKLADEGQA